MGRSLPVSKLALARPLLARILDVPGLETAVATSNYLRDRTPAAHVQRFEDIAFLVNVLASGPELSAFVQERT